MGHHVLTPQWHAVTLRHVVAVWLLLAPIRLVGPMAVRSLQRRLVSSAILAPRGGRHATGRVDDWLPLRCRQHCLLPSLQATRPPSTCLPLRVVHGVPQGTGVQGTRYRPRVGRAPGRFTFRDSGRSRRGGHQQWAGTLPALLPQLQGANVTGRLLVELSGLGPTKTPNRPEPLTDQRGGAKLSRCQHRSRKAPPVGHCSRHGLSL